MTAVTAPEIAAPVKAGGLPFSRKTLIAVGGAVAVAALGGVVIAMPKSAETTDAAYLAADSAQVAPRVKGQVAQVLVVDNQAVHRGDPLIRLDPEEFDARVAAAAADLQTAQAQVQSARAAFNSLGAEEQLAQSNIAAAQTQVGAAEAQSARAVSDRRRYESLAQSGAVATRDIEQIQTTAVAAQAEAQRTRQQVQVSRDQAAVTGAKSQTLAAGLAQAEAAVARATAALALARQDQTHTLITAPIDGVVGDRHAEPGDYVEPGSRLLTVVPLGRLYVSANFKETQTGRMAVGQPAKVKVDALPGRALTGHVESFAPGSGSQFSLLPFEPGTGNFTKIVQRVAVRIRLDPGQPGLAQLRPGLSTTVTVKLR
jgi:membrane fusion protein (multidrug efflux system)